VISQSPQVTYRGLDGKQHKITFDFQSLHKNGTRTAYSIKPNDFLKQSGIEEIHSLLQRQMSPCVAILEVRGLGIKHGGISYSDEPLQKAIDEIAKRFVQEDEAEKNGGKRKRAGRRRDKGPRTPPGPKCLRGWIKELIAGGMNPLALRTDYRKCGNHDPRL
jgi:hypothetical protein